MRRDTLPVSASVNRKVCLQGQHITNRRPSIIFEVLLILSNVLIKQNVAHRILSFSFILTTRSDCWAFGRSIRGLPGAGGCVQKFNCIFICFSQFSRFPCPGGCVCGGLANILPLLPRQPTDAFYYDFVCRCTTTMMDSNCGTICGTRDPAVRQWWAVWSQFARNVNRLVQLAYWRSCASCASVCLLVIGSCVWNVIDSLLAWNNWIPVRRLTR